MAAAEKAGKKLFFGSYPITPASDILHELSRYKNLGVITLQAEDEIAAVCSAIGASYAGQIGVTASSGPGIALKSEAINLAVMAEVPVVIVDVQRGGPSTGLPTKTEQADLNLAVYGRNSESPVVVLAATTPSHCFEAAYTAVKLAIEHMTPVILLSDGFLANGSEPWKVPQLDQLPAIQVKHPTAPQNGRFHPYMRDPETLVRPWAIPGTPGLEHRIGGLEKQDVTGNVSYDPKNHEKMVNLRAEKVARVANRLPQQQVIGTGKAPLLVVGWGGTYGALYTAVTELQQVADVDYTHFTFINPLPKNTASLLQQYPRVLVCELNRGQFAALLRSHTAHPNIVSFTKVQGQPFLVSELKEAIQQQLNLN
jgi:2-oxoglutarate ferredoxin oxidoreductase subunit alpha